MESKIKIFGHPIHPMVIAYPVAFYTATLVGFVIYGATGDHFWLKLTIAANLAGVAMAVVAALPGFLDWLLAVPRGTETSRTGLFHMLLNVTALVLFAVSLISYIGKWSSTTGTGAALGIVLAALGVAVTIGAGFLGWSLVQDHHVGVRPVRDSARSTRTARAA
jgi:uncharacterized membrane protein